MFVSLSSFIRINEITKNKLMFNSRSQGESNKDSQESTKKGNYKYKQKLITHLDRRGLKSQLFGKINNIENGLGQDKT